MIGSIVTWMMSIFNSKFLVVGIVSMIPMIETRGAIPIALELGFSPFESFIFGALSSLIICPILVFGLKPILKLLKKIKFFNKLAIGIEDIFAGKAEGIEKKKKTEMNLMLALFVFVAFPLPLTGVWTGSGIAAFIGLKARYSIPAIVIGNFVAAGIITLLTVLLGDKADIVIYVLMAFVVISLVGIIFKILKGKKKDA